MCINNEVNYWVNSEAEEDDFDRYLVFGAFRTSATGTAFYFHNLFRRVYFSLAEIPQNIFNAAELRYIFVLISFSAFCA